MSNMLTTKTRKGVAVIIAKGSNIARDAERKGETL